MRRRLLASFVVLAALAPSSAHADVGRFIAAEPVDGPVTALGDLDLARDGTGGMVYVKPDGGTDHIFVTRMQDGAWQPPERVDAALPTASSQPVLAAGDGGRLDIAFISAGTLYATVKPAADQPYSPVQAVFAPASNPSIDLSINDVAYVSFTNPAGAGGGDVIVARKERKTTAFGVVPGVLDIDPANGAGIDTGRSRVAVAADGVALVVWGEAGNVFARRVFEGRLSAAPQNATLPALGPAPGLQADSPDVDVQDDSSFAWVVFRETFADAPGGHARAIARRLRGSLFDDGVVVDGIGGLPSADSVGPPRIAINGRGEGYAASAGTATVFGAVLKDRTLNPAIPVGTGFAGAVLPVAATDENGDGLVAWQNADLTIHARAYTNVRARRAVQAPQPDTPLSLGPTDAADGLEASADRAGDMAVAFVQGAPGARSLAVASFDRAPGAFRLNSSSSYRNVAATPLKWSQSFELWGPLTYAVEIDGRIVGTTPATALALPGLPDGPHRWRVIATDRRGQVTATRLGTLRTDATPPRARVTVSGARRRGQAVRVNVRPTDANPKRRPASGVGRVQIAWGDGSRTTARRGTHRYRRGGKMTLRVSVRDRANNVVIVRRSLTIR